MGCLGGVFCREEIFIPTQFQNKSILAGILKLLNPTTPILVSCFPWLDVRERWGGSLPSWYAVLI